MDRRAKASLMSASVMAALMNQLWCGWRNTPWATAADSIHMDAIMIVNMAGIIVTRDHSMGSRLLRGRRCSIRCKHLTSRPKTFLHL